MENQAAQVVAEICPRHAAACAHLIDGTDGEAHWPFLIAKYMFDTGARMADRVTLPRSMCLAIGLPRGFLRWMWERYPLAFNQASFFAEQ